MDLHLHTAFQVDQTSQSALQYLSYSPIHKEWMSDPRLPQYKYK